MRQNKEHAHGQSLSRLSRGELDVKSGLPSPRWVLYCADFSHSLGEKRCGVMSVVLRQGVSMWRKGD